jgi:cyclic pyranopterin phosphate synthase
MTMARLSPLDASGAAKMVDVSAKRPSRRRAVARGWVSFNARAFARLRENRLAKGDALAVARLAGIQAAKRTADWIPLCHNVPLDHLDVSIELNEEDRSAVVTAEARARWTTGVEMEALVAVSAACLALYDMAKSIDRAITIGEIQLVLKEGGKSGRWERSGARSPRAAR